MQQVIHLLNRVAFGPRPGDIKQITPEKYLDEQLHPERIDDSEAQARVASLKSLSMATADIIDAYQPPRPLLEELCANKIIRAVHSERQLHEVMTDFWYNHFNIFWGKRRGQVAHNRIRDERHSPACARKVSRPAFGDG